MKWSRMIKRLILFLYIPLVVNVPLWTYGIYTGRFLPGTWLSFVPCLGAVLLLMFAAWLYLNILPFHDSNKVSLRYTVMRGGHTLGYCAIYGMLLQALLFIFLYPKLAGGEAPYPGWILAVNGIYALVMLLIFLWNGILRMFLTSSRLRLRTRVLMILAMWIPVLNLLVLLYAMRLVLAEYDFACYKESVRSIRAESDMCRTKYPLILVHGVGFRDLKYFNYWGSFPRNPAVCSTRRFPMWRACTIRVMRPL